MGVAQKTNEFKSAIKSSLEHTLGEGGSIDVKELQGRAGEAARTALGKVEQFCKERPVVAIGIGVLVGAVLAGRIFKKA